MQDRYAGDVGDYIKLGLLRTLAAGRTLGVAWYLYPDEAHNDDGKHIAYLSEPAKWRHLDPELVDGLCRLVSATRSVAEIERSGILTATFHSDSILSMSVGPHEREEHRKRWFDRLRETLLSCDLIFADPDNGLVYDAPARLRDRKHAKQISLGEALALANGRPAVIYHHNSRFRGGHDQEVDHWLTQLGPNALAIRATAFSCRTFFILNPDEGTRDRAEKFCIDWKSAKVRLHPNSNGRQFP